MAIDTMWASVLELRNDASVRQSALMPFVVRKEKRKEKKQDSSSPKVERKVRGVCMNPIELQSGSNYFRFCQDHREWNYCMFVYMNTN